jgi:hypothetical protein
VTPLLPTGTISGSVQVLGGTGIVSGSSQITYTSISSIPTGIVSGSAQVTPLLPTGVVSGSTQVITLLPTGVVSSSAQTIENLPTGTISGSAQITTLGFVSSSVTASSLVTASVNVNILTFTKGNGSTFDLTIAASGSAPAGTISGSAQITTLGFISSSSVPAGTISGSSQIIANLPTGVVSGSSQITLSSTTGFSTFSSSVANDITSLNSYTSSLRGAITISGTDVSLAGNLTVLGTTTIIDSTVVNIKDNIIQLNGAGSANAGLVVRDATGTTTSGSLLWDTTNDYWIAGPLGAESKLLRQNGDNVISSSTQIPSLLPAGVVSGSSQITYASISSIPGGIVSGSSQVLGGTAIHSGSSGDYQFNSIGIGTAASGVSGEIRATNDITAFYSSDIRLKENIQPIQNALEKVESISGNTYDWKEGFDEIHSHKGNDIGVIAQEIEEILPQIVTNRDNGYKAVQYEKIVPLLIEAIKELSEKIKRLENK